MLVVEDNPLNVKLIRDVLEYQGFDGLTATSGEDGVVAALTASHLESDDLRALSVDDLFDAVARHGLHFDESTQTGVVFHMTSCLSECGRVGMTTVGETPEQAMGDLRTGSAHPSRRGQGRAPGR